MLFVRNLIVGLGLNRKKIIDLKVILSKLKFWRPNINKNKLQKLFASFTLIIITIGPSGLWRNMLIYESFEIGLSNGINYYAQQNPSVYK